MDERERRITRVATELQRAWRYASTDPEVALPLARKAGEMLAGAVFADVSGARHASPEFHHLISDLEKRGAIPRKLVAPLRTIQHYGNFGAHAQPELDQVDLDYLRPCLEALQQLSTWYFAEHLRRTPPELRLGAPDRGGSRSQGGGRLSIASAEEVWAWGWDGQALLDRLISLDYETIEGLDEDSEGHTDQWAPVFMDHPDTWRLLVDGPGHVVGYWHFVPLFDEDWTLACRGGLHDAQITVDRVPSIELPGVYRIYFVSIALLPRYRGAIGFRPLMDALVGQLVQLAERDVFIDAMCTNAMTPAGNALCRTLGMVPVTAHQVAGQIYSLRFIPLPDRLRASWPALAHAYARAPRSG